jgi:8-oxo-dGTP diphosphatase
MHTIYYGTNNVAKINYIKNIVSALPVTIVGINELNAIDHTINEDGKEPIHNARIKAWHYYNQINRPVFSCDSGLFFENAAYEDQSGTHIRRINGKVLTDDEMIGYYSKLAEKYGGTLTAFYKNAICIIINKETIIECDDGKINSEQFIITTKPHEKRDKGFPLDSLSKEIKSGKYYYDINRVMDNENTEKEYRALFKRAIESMDKL